MKPILSLWAASFGCILRQANSVPCLTEDSVLMQFLMVSVPNRKLCIHLVSQFMFCVLVIGVFVSCGDWPPQQPDPIKDYSGCYRVRIRHYDLMHSMGWWEVKNVCYNQNGDWIESNGLNVRIGNSDGKTGVFSVDTIAVTLNPDTTKPTKHIYHGFYYYGQDTVNVGVGLAYPDGTRLLIYGREPTKLKCWEYILSDSLSKMFSKMNIITPNFCPKTIDEIMDSTFVFDRLN